MEKNQLFTISATDIHTTLKINSVCLQQIIAESNLTQFIYNYREVSSELINLNNRQDIIEYIQAVLNNNLHRKIINTTFSKIRSEEKISKNNLNSESHRSFSSFDTMLAARNFRKKNYMSSDSKMEMQIYNKPDLSELNYVEETTHR